MPAAKGTIPADKARLNTFLRTPSGSEAARSAIDGMLRSTAWHHLDDRGLIVVVALNLQARLDLLNPAAEQTRGQTGS